MGTVDISTRHGDSAAMWWSRHLVILSTVTCLTGRRVGIRRTGSRGADEAGDNGNPCHQMASCSECIRVPECAWCADPDWDPVIHSDLKFSDLTFERDATNSTIQAKEIKARCDRIVKFEQNPSLCTSVENPQNTMTVEQNSPLTLDDNLAGKFVQISP